jgi:magnesium transporter
MSKVTTIILKIEENLSTVIREDSALGVDLWKLLLEQHPADIAKIVENAFQEHQINLVKKLDPEIAAKVFRKLPSNLQVALIEHFENEFAVFLLENIPVDDLTDLFDYFNDEHLEKYLRLLQNKHRSHIISLLHFDPHSAGGRMNSDVLTLQEDMTIKKSIELLQRIKIPKDLLDRIYVTDRESVLVGHITLDKLVVNKPQTTLGTILEKNDFHAQVNEDQEEVANQMLHYDLSSVPVVDNQNHFLGVITAYDVAEILKEEGKEDVYKMSGMSSPQDHFTYFTTPIWKLIRQRSPWLISLLLLQSVSSMILDQYNEMLSSYAIITLFLTMLTGTGGNAGNQSATLIIRGLTTKEISRKNALRALFREMGVSIILAFMLSTVGFFRVYYFHQDFVSAAAVNISLFMIVITSVFLGAAFPILLERLNIDPANSAAPFIATLMDILGVLIYCFVCSRIFG